MSAHKKARVVATAKSGIVVGGAKRRHGGLYAKVWGLAGGGLFVACLVALGVFYWLRWHQPSKSPELAAQIASLQSQIKANANQPGIRVDLYRQLAVACAKEGNMSCANNAQSKLAALSAPDSPGVYITKARIAAAAGDTQQAITDYKQAITAVHTKDGSTIPPIDQSIIAGIQTQIAALQKSSHE